MTKLEINQERLDFVTDKDIERLCTDLAEKFGKEALSGAVSWALSNGYRTGIKRGIEMAQEVNSYIQSGVEDETC